MTQFVELEIADGRELDVPMEGILAFMGIPKGHNPNFPDAIALVWYVLGAEIRSALLTNSVSDLILDLNINVAPQDWMRLHQHEDGEEVVIRARDVKGRLQLEDRTQLVVEIGGNPRTFEVKEERRQIKKWMERAERGGSAMPLDPMDAPPPPPEEPAAPAPRPRRQRKAQ